MEGVREVVGEAEVWEVAAISSGVLARVMAEEEIPSVTTHLL